MREDLSLSLKLTARDARGRELGLLLAALVVAVAAIASVGLFADRLRGALVQQAHQLLGADLVIVSNQRAQPELTAEATRLGVRTAETVVFPSMVLASSGPPRLAAVKVVSAGYPLRGAVRVAPAHNAPDSPAPAAPASGQVWLDPQLADSLSVQVGDEVRLGDARLQVAALVTLEPDRGTGFVNLAPRALMALDDLEGSGLVQPASRVQWRLLAAGEPQAVSSFERWAAQHLQRGQHIETLQTGRPELDLTLNRAEQFLSLVALLTSLIAAVAIVLAARRFAQRHLDAAAVMRSIGITQARLARLLALELAWIALAGAVAGLVLGALLHLGLVAAIAPLINTPLPAPGMAPVVQAVLAAFVLLLGFGGFPFLRLAAVPPLRVLRRELAQAPAGAWATVVGAAGLFLLISVAVAGERRMALYALGGFVVATLLFAAVAGVVLLLVTRLGSGRSGGGSVGLRLALAAWSRRRIETMIQVAALAIGLMALVLLSVTRADLVAGWRAAAPPDAPNRFVINVQPQQKAFVQQAFAEANVRAELLPMVRGRLVSVNGQPVDARSYEGDRARGLIEREFNLSWMQSPPPHNRIVQGRWFDSSAAEVSAEKGIMATLNLALDDLLQFEVAGEPVDVRITSVRDVAWDSMQVNFFMILSPAALANAPTTWITAYHEPATTSTRTAAAGPASTAHGPGAGQPVDRLLVERFPNLTVFDTTSLVRQVQAMVDQVVGAVEILFLLSLAAGVVVLWAALASARDERLREAALMRALGASRRQLSTAQAIELAGGGALAGLLGAAAATAVGALLASRVFRFDFNPDWLVLPAAGLFGALVVLAAGWWSLRGVLSSPPGRVLRDS